MNKNKDDALLPALFRYEPVKQIPNAASQTRTDSSRAFPRLKKQNQVGILQLFTGE